MSVIACTTCGERATWMALLSCKIWSTDMAFYYCTHHKVTHVLVDAMVVEAFALGSHTISIEWLRVI
jgi:hypothetical protein